MREERFINYDGDVSLLEFLETLLEVTRGGQAQVVALPALIEDVIHEINSLEERVTAYSTEIERLRNAAVLCPSCYKEDTPK